MSIEIYFVIGVVLFVSGAVLSLMIARRAKGYLYIISAAGALGLIISGLYLSSGMKIYIPTVHISPVLEFVFQADPLSGFFVTAM